MARSSPLSRRTFLTTSVVAALAGLAGCQDSQNQAPDQDPPTKHDRRGNHVHARSHGHHDPHRHHNPRDDDLDGVDTFDEHTDHDDVHADHYDDVDDVVFVGPSTLQRR